MFNRLPKHFKVEDIIPNSQKALSNNDIELYVQYVTFYKYFIA